MGIVDDFLADIRKLGVADSGKEVVFARSVGTPYEGGSGWAVRYAVFDGSLERTFISDKRSVDAVVVWRNRFDKIASLESVHSHVDRYLSAQGTKTSWLAIDWVRSFYVAATAERFGFCREEGESVRAFLNGAALWPTTRAEPDRARLVDALATLVRKARVRRVLIDVGLSFEPYETAVTRAIESLTIAKSNSEHIACEKGGIHASAPQIEALWNFIVTERTNSIEPHCVFVERGSHAWTESVINECVACSDLVLKGGYVFVDGIQKYACPGPYVRNWKRINDLRIAAGKKAGSEMKQSDVNAGWHKWRVAIPDGFGHREVYLFAPNEASAVSKAANGEFRFQVDGGRRRSSSSSSYSKAKLGVLKLAGELPPIDTISDWLNLNGDGPIVFKMLEEWRVTMRRFRVAIPFDKKFMEVYVLATDADEAARKALAGVYVYELDDGELASRWSSDKAFGKIGVMELSEHGRIDSLDDWKYLASKSSMGFKTAEERGAPADGWLIKPKSKTTLPVVDSIHPAAPFIVTKKESKMSDVMIRIKEEATSAGVRAGAAEFIDAVREPVVRALMRDAGIGSGVVGKGVRTFLQTQLGEGVFSYVVGAAMPLVAKAPGMSGMPRDMIEGLGKELRVAGQTTMFRPFIRALINPVRDFFEAKAFGSSKVRVGELEDEDASGEEQEEEAGTAEAGRKGRKG